MEELCVAVECVSSYPMGKSAQGAVDLLHPGVDAPGMTTDAVVRQSGADHLGGGASAAVAAGLFRETGAGIGLSPETGTISPQDPSHGQGVAPGLPRGNEDLKGWTMQDPVMVVKTSFYHLFLFRVFFFHLCDVHLRYCVIVIS